MPGSWVSAAQARADLRRFVNDGDRDRPVKEKIIIGAVDGANKTFYTWDDRLVDDDSFRVTIDSEELPTTEVTLDDPILGRIVLTNAPAPSSSVRARYFFQYFLDTELDEALQMAAGEITEGEDITSVPPGLRLAALHYGGHFSYQKQAMRWAQRMSSKFLLEEEPTQAETLGRSNFFRQIAKDLRDTADVLRDQFYMRHGRRHAPAWNVYKPNIPPIAPIR